MGFNFVTADREQGFLLPPDVRDWLPGDHVVWAVIDACGTLDLSEFRVRYRADGHGRAAYDPAVMVALLLWAYCDGVRSARQIERNCQRDVAYRVVAGNLCPDHATISRFRVQHQQALRGVFVQVLRLCAEAGLVDARLVAVDGTKLIANAAGAANRTRAQLEADIAREAGRLLDESAEIDAAEDREAGSGRGGGPPAPPTSPSTRLARLQAAKQRLDTELDQRDARRQALVDRHAAARAAGQPIRGRPPKTELPRDQQQRSQRANTTDPDSRIMKTRSGWVQGYNAQMLAGRRQIILATDITQCSADTHALHPLLGAARANLTAAAVTTRMRACLADAGYACEHNFTTDTEPLLLIATDAERHQTGRTAGKPTTTPPQGPGWDRMRARLATPAGRGLYRRRSPMIEPIFAQLTNRLGRVLSRRGLPAARTEVTLMAASHNLLKLIAAQRAPAIG